MRSTGVIFSVLCAVLVLAAPVHAQNRKESPEARKARLEREIAILDKQYRETSAKSDNALSSLNLVRRKVASRKKLVSESDREVAAMDRKIASQKALIRDMEVRMDSMGVYYGRLVRTAYKNRDSRLWYMYILSSGDLGQAAGRYRYLKTLSDRMNGQASEILSAKERLEKEQRSLETMRHDALKLREKRVQELGRLKKEEAASDRLATKLKKERNKYQKQLSAKRKQVEALNREVSKMVSTKRTTPKDVKLDAQFAANKGKLPWPAEGPVVDTFGEHYHPVYTKVKLPFNNGINIALSKDTAVKSVFDGVVKQIIVMPGYNQCVLVEHGGYYTFYCKLTGVNVKSGDKIKTGQVIGRVDTIAGETQLHFQLWEGKTPRDPEAWLR